MVQSMETDVSQKKMGFWSVMSLVAGSQIGTGIFLLSASMAPLGAAGVSSYLVTATGALLLALVFARLCAHIPRSGGPHVFIEQAFGRTAGFFAAWTYWVISWLSTPMVVISVITYLTPLWGDLSSGASLALQVGVLAAMTALNLYGVRSAGLVEVVFTLLKLVPLLIVPLAGLFFMQASHFVPFNPTSESLPSVMNAAALLTLWGFIGVESATASIGSVESPQTTVPRAIVLGTTLVAVVYIFSSTVVLGVVPIEILGKSVAPFADTAEIIFGGSWSKVIAIITSIVCLGSLNAWVLTSGQIALGAASDGYLPRLLSVKNRHGAPKWGLIISSLGIVPVLMMTLHHDLMAFVHVLVDVSVTACLFIYAASALSYLRMFHKRGWAPWFVGMGALVFCGWALYASGGFMIALAMVVPILGIPVFVVRKERVTVQAPMLREGG